MTVPRSPYTVAVLFAALTACAVSFAQAAAPHDCPCGSASPAAVEPGIEVLLKDRIDLIQGKNVGLITNPTGVNENLASDIELLERNPHVHLVALYGPESGLRGAHQAGAPVGSYRDKETGLPVYSLFGKTHTPTAKMLKNVDVLIYDIQSVGTRFYTNLSTMADAMQAAAKNHIPFIVCDRPNPLGGIQVQGPVLEPGEASFVGMYPIALRYGMTTGELAKMFNQEFGIHADLTVVKMRGWKRSMYYDDTSLPFVMPSPNMPTLNTELVYPGMGLIEGTNISEGRGTTRPFELAGAPWIDAEALVRALNAKHLAGVRFRAAHFTPTFSKYQGELCNGLEVYVRNRKVFNPVLTGLTVIKTIHDMYPHKFAFSEVSHFDHLIGNSWVREGIEHGISIQAMQKRWQKGLKQFKAERREYLLY